MRRACGCTLRELPVHPSLGVLVVEGGEPHVTHAPDDSVSELIFGEHIPDLFFSVDLEEGVECVFSGVARLLIGLKLGVLDQRGAGGRSAVSLGR